MNETSELESLWDEAKGYIDQGEHQRAVDLYKYILIRYADNRKAVEYASAYLGDVLLTTRQHLALAEKYLRKAISLSPNEPHYHYLLGFVSSVRKQFRKATQAFKKAVALSPNNSEYERCLGWAMFNGPDREGGLDHLNRALELAPNDVSTMTDLGTAMLVLRDFNLARRYAKDALRIDPDNELAKELARTIDSVQKKLG